MSTERLRTGFEPAVQDWADDTDNASVVDIDRMSKASIAISLKRIADMLEGVTSIKRTNIADIIVGIVQEVDGKIIR